MSTDAKILSHQKCVNCGADIYVIDDGMGNVYRKGCVHARFATMEKMEKRADRLTSLILARGARKDAKGA